MGGILFMGGTKFMVIKFKELLKTAIFAVLGVVIILALIYMVTGRKDGNETSYVPGTYNTAIDLNNDQLEVAVTVDNHKITKVDLIHTSETIPVFYPLFDSTIDSIGKEIVAKQSVDVEIPSEATVTGNLIIDAVKESLAQAEVKN